MVKNLEKFGGLVLGVLFVIVGIAFATNVLVSCLWFSAVAMIAAAFFLQRFFVLRNSKLDVLLAALFLVLAALGFLSKTVENGTALIQASLPAVSLLAISLVFLCDRALNAEPSKRSANVILFVVYSLGALLSLYALLYVTGSSAGFNNFLNQFFLSLRLSTGDGLTIVLGLIFILKFFLADLCENIRQ